MLQSESSEKMRSEDEIRKVEISPRNQDRNSILRNGSFRKLKIKHTMSLTPDIRLDSTKKKSGSKNKDILKLQKINEEPN